MPLQTSIRFTESDLRLLAKLTRELTKVQGKVSVASVLRQSLLSYARELGLK
jgi:hypothetical protein